MNNPVVKINVFKEGTGFCYEPSKENKNKVPFVAGLAFPSYDAAVKAVTKRYAARGYEVKIC